MARVLQLPFPVLDALPLGAHRLSVLTDQALFDAVGVRLAFTGRAGGVSVGPYASLNTASHVGDDIEHVRRNRAILCEAAAPGVAGDPLMLNQVHGTDFVRVENARELASAAGRAQEGADGVVVTCDGVPAILNAGDCLLVALVSPSGRFALAHAGWRGAVAGIAGKAARLLADGDAFSPGDYNAYLGPHIRQECFEVGPEVEERFRARFGDTVIPEPRHVSLAAAVSADLREAGLRSKRIADAGICTNCNPGDYYSYRAENGICGRHAAFAVRVRQQGVAMPH